MVIAFWIVYVTVWDYTRRKGSCGSPDYSDSGFHRKKGKKHVIVGEKSAVASDCKLMASKLTSFPVASHAGVFSGARFSSLPTNACSTEDNIPFPMGRDEKRAPLKTPAWEASFPAAALRLYFGGKSGVFYFPLKLLNICWPSKIVYINHNDPLPPPPNLIDKILLILGRATWRNGSLG